MKVLIIGSGGREHAIVDALTRSPEVSKIYCAPGNAGIAVQAECVDIKDTQIDELLAFACDNSIDLTVVGGETALSLGIVDMFQAEGLRIFGPTKSAAMVESSKQWAKDLMLKYDIPTAAYEVFSDYDEAKAYVHAQGAPIVLKYDGLAAGKGVVVAQTLAEADTALGDMLLDDKFGHGKVVIEECLTGPEFSFLCFTDGENAYPMPATQDHKRAFDGDLGPNTGGMGAYTPLPFLTDEHKDYALNQIVLPMLKAMKTEGAEFRGVLYAGLMLTPAGIKVIEFNARFGDPETEVILPLLRSDIFTIFASISEGKPLSDIEWSSDASLGVVLASKGYPDAYEKGHIIRGVEDVTQILYQMGTARNENNQLITNGGRVLFLTAIAPTLKQAQEIANEEIKKIHCDNLFHRTDIGGR